jgi:hypothetical protein
MEFFNCFEKGLFFIVFVQNCLGCVPRPEKCEKLPKKFGNRSFLANIENQYFSNAERRLGNADRILALQNWHFSSANQI